MNLAIGSAVTALGGIAIDKTLMKIADQGDKLLDQQAQLRQAGVAQNDILKLQSNYYDNISKAIPTSEASEFLKSIREMRSVTGAGPAGLANAATLAQHALKIDALMNNALGRTDSSDEFYKLLRASEMKGIATNPALRTKLVDQAFSYISAFGGKLTPEDYQTFARRGGSAFINADLDKAIGPLSVLMADLKGPAAGTAAMTLQQLQLGATTLTKQQLAMMEKAGLIDESKVHKMGMGHFGMDPGAILGSSQYAGDLPGWIQKVIMPHLEAISGGDKATLESDIAKFAPNRNAQKLVQMFGEPGFQDQIAKDLGLAKLVMTIDEAYQNLIKTNPKGVKAAFWAQEESMMEAIGAPLAQAAIPVMQQVTEWFEAIGAWSNAHPTLIKDIGVAVAGLGTSMVVLGTAGVPQTAPHTGVIREPPTPS